MKCGTPSEVQVRTPIARKRNTQMLQSLELLTNTGTGTLHGAACGQKFFSTLQSLCTGRSIMVPEL